MSDSKKLLVFRLAGLWLLLYFALVIDKLPRFIGRNFGALSFEQFLYHITAAEGAPAAIVQSALSRFVVEPVFFASLFVLLAWLGHRFFSIAVAVWLRRIMIVSGVIVMALGLIQTGHLLDFNDYLKSRFNGHNKADWMAELYRAPKVIAAPVKPKNLIILYVESLESQMVPKDSSLREDLGILHPGSFSIMPGTQWTLAGFVSSQCAVPLFPVAGVGANRYGLLGSSFMRHATCLGDVLNSHGYQGEYVGGARSVFAGKDNFLKSHGFNKVTGRDELSAIYPLASFPDGWWGYGDDLVFDYAKNRLTQLKNAGKPFFFSLLTLDTHGPKGIYTDFCKKNNFPDSLDGIFDCSVFQLSEFMQWLKLSGFLKDSVVVVMGDHPFMAPEYRKSLIDKKWKSLSARDVFFGMSIPGKQKVDVSDMNHFDVAPTILGALDFQLEGNRFGLGRNLLVVDSSQTEINSEFLRSFIRRPSNEYNKLWGVQ